MEDNPVIPVYDTAYTSGHIEMDKFVEGNFLFCEYQALLTTDLKTKELVVGQDYRTMDKYFEDGIGANASFGSLRSFTQPNHTHVFIADTSHCCLRSVDRRTNKTGTLAGICREHFWDRPELVDGELLNSTFDMINSITYHDGIVYAVETGKGRIRKIDLANNLVTTLATKEEFPKYHGPQNIAVDPARRLLFINAFRSISQLSMDGGELVTLSKAEGLFGIEEGPIENTTWSFIKDIKLVGKDTLILAGGETFRIIHIPSMTVSTWCFTFYAASSNCTYGRPPQALLIKDRQMYITIEDTISTLQLPAWFENEDDGLFNTKTRLANLPGKQDFSDVELYSFIAFST